MTENCPPADASPMDGVIYRAVNKEMTLWDFQSHHERNPQKYKSCRAKGLSIWIDINRAKHHITAFDSCVLAQVSVVKADGVRQKTGASADHWTYWAAKSSDLLQKAKFV